MHRGHDPLCLPLLAEVAPLGADGPTQCGRFGLTAWQSPRWLVEQPPQWAVEQPPQWTIE